jgi:signal transduction histidine kinase/ligand-binding sensor domain-containing protein/DNA-binding response OmpR family regulator
MTSYAQIVLTILLLPLVIHTPIYSQSKKIIFEHIRVEEGLPSNNVTCILQDHFGFLWLGTEHGLVRYDGYSMIVYKPKMGDATSISGSYISTIYEDFNGNLWIGTRGMGLNRFDRNSETFTSYKYNKNDPACLNSNSIKCIYGDKAKRLWIGTDKGLNLFFSEKKTFAHYILYNPDNIIDTDNNSTDKNIGAINDIIEDPITGRLLIGSNISGLWEFDFQTKNFTKYNLSKIDNDFNSISINIFNKPQNGKLWMGTNNGLAHIDLMRKEGFIYKTINSSNYEIANDFISIVQDSKGLIWVGTYGEGLAIFNPITNNFTRHTYDIFDNQSLYGYRVLSLYEDYSGIIWIGIDTGGLDRWDTKKWKFKHYRENPYNTNSLRENWVQSICEGNNGKIWIGTEGGLNLFDREQNRFTNYFHDPQNSNSLSSDLVWSILEDPDEQEVLWIGTARGGLNKFDYTNGRFYHYRNDPNNKYSLSNDGIYTMLLDHEGILWIGTFGGGLNRFDRRFNRFTSFQHIPGDSTSISENNIVKIYEDREGIIWIGTNSKGLCKFDRKSGTFTNYKTIIGDDILGGVHTIYEDMKGNFWISNIYSKYSNGLHLLDREKGVIVKYYGEEEGLRSELIFAILEDDSGNLWLNTFNGISKFNPITETFRNYDVSDGLAGIRCNPGAIKIKSGEMLVGSSDGLTIFHPDSVRDDPVPPLVVISNITLFNQNNEKLIFEKYVAELEELKLSHDQNDLRFDYVGLHYSDPSKNKYAYTLVNFNQDWIDAGTQRNATYTNLDPGEYIFKVKASNMDGIWSKKEASIKIIILPPIWATTWAYIIYTLIVLSIIYFTWKLQLKRIRIKHDYEMSRFEAEKMHEVDELKSRFFANISHEFRTPLTLIFGPAKDVIEKTKEPDTKRNVGVIKRNASRLYSLVNQLLDLSKLESGKMKLEASEQDLILLLKGIFLSFTSFAERKKITLKFNTIEENLYVYIDRDKVEKIINNLLSNAFKFTPEGGRIDFKVEQLINEVEIGITDNGIGIPKERIDKIFDRFYQVDSSHTRQGEGTGIGLALTKELVELHKGKIKVESKEGEGTTVSVQLPLGKDHLKPEEIVDKQVEEIIPETEELSEPLLDTENRKEKTDLDVLLDTDKPLLLIVEDNSDVRSYIISHLEEDYRIQEAVDGEDGLEKALNHIPDLIISDVMMPKMDGFELCNKLKTDERTSHIPIIMLTAKATSKDKIEGYETGADDYIMKPFDADELKARIKNLIEIRRNLQKKFSENEYSIPKELSSIDEQYLKKAFQVINEHLSEEEFSVEQFCLEVGMSDVQNYRKLKALTGRSPSSFIRSIRLKKAKNMIEERRGTISEIAYSVGFGSPSYFTKCFKEEYGYLPSETIK